MKKTPLRLLTMLLTLALLVGLVPLSASAAKEVQYGLTLKDGRIYLDGNIFYGMGVNYYDPFLVYLRGNTENQKDVEKEFQTLADSQIPVVRISMCGYAANEFGEYMEYPNYYFKYLDQTVALAEKYQIGIIFDLAWAIDAIPNYCWEFRSDIGDVNSETMRVAKAYVKDVVTRYKNSPAVWAWEIGNEYNLDADLEGVLHREESQIVTSADIHVYYEELAKVIREVDPYRLITGGDSEPRSAAYNLYHNDSWRQDTYEQMAEMMYMLSPEPMNMMSVHVYQDADNSEAGASSVTMDKIEDFDTQVKNYMKAARAVGQALFVGEFGIMERTCKDQSVAKAILKAQYDAFMKHGVQLSCIWVYGKDDGDVMNIAPDNNLAYQYNVVVNGNIRYRKEGKQDTANYWKNATPLMYKTETPSTSSTTTAKPTTKTEASSTVTTTTTAASATDTQPSVSITTTTSTTVSSTTAKTQTTQPPVEDEGNGSPWLWVGLGAGILVIATVGVTLWLTKGKKERRK